MEKEEKEEEKQEIKGSKRKRSSRGTESPAKKPKELSKSASTSSLASSGSAPARGRGRPPNSRRSLLAKLPEPPVTDAFKIETAPRAKLLAFGMGDAGQLGMGEDIMERKRPQPVKVTLTLRRCESQFFVAFQNLHFCNGSGLYFR